MIDWRKWMIAFVELRNGQEYNIDCWKGNIAFKDFYPQPGDLQPALDASRFWQ